MQGINKARHLQLLEILLQVEQLLLGKDMGAILMETAAMPNGILDAQELSAKRAELQNSHRIYLDMLDKLAFHIAAYEDLVVEVRVRYLSNHLKKLKKQALHSTHLALADTSSLLNDN